MMLLSEIVPGTLIEIKGPICLERAIMLRKNRWLVEDCVFATSRDSEDFKWLMPTPERISFKAVILRREIDVNSREWLQVLIEGEIGWARCHDEFEFVKT